MASKTASAGVPDAGQQFATLLAQDGSAVQPALARLAQPRAPLRDLADALHCLCLLHGHRPGPVDVARDRANEASAAAWLGRAAEAFAAEREWLARLVAALGPAPSTVNQTAAESAIATQRHAIEMLAVSDRHGCALGAAAVLVADWRAVRGLLDRIGERLGLAAPASALPDAAAAQTLLDDLALPPAQVRAFHFGAQQLLAQQRGLWALVDARADSRTPH